MSFRLSSSFLGLCVAAHASQSLRAANETSPNSVAQIVYMSSDLNHVAVFTKESGRFGNDLALSAAIWPSSPARYFEPAEGLRCVSLGSSPGGTQFAIKRPITLDEKYQCLNSHFRVVKCYFECRAAVIRVDSPLSGNISGFIESYIYVDDCFGILAFNVSKKLNKGVPLNAEWLRGEVGILANPDYPKCRPF